MKSLINPFENNLLIILHDKLWLDRQRVAGAIAAKALNMLELEVNNKTTKSLLELNNITEHFIISSGCTPTFKGYKGFPYGVCMSVNRILVHGMPADIKLREGDHVSFDLGVTFEGAIADTAISCIYGKPKSARHELLVKTTKECLTKAIQSIKVGNKIGCIGHAIHKHARSKGFLVVNQYGGHGLQYNKPHAEPFVFNKSEEDEGITIQPGLVIAVEPLLVLNGSTETKILKDGWSVLTQDIGSHEEHSLYVHEDYVEVITSRD